jgi:predicted TIM-barrel fold metal-dependent hydrolase
MPEHVMFGTDAGPFGPGLEWQETTVLGAQKMRRALALTLTGMIDEGVITPQRAREIADRVLRANAAALYRIK